MQANSSTRAASQVQNHAPESAMGRGERASSRDFTQMLIAGKVLIAHQVQHQCAAVAAQGPIAKVPLKPGAGLTAGRQLQRAAVEDQDAGAQLRQPAHGLAIAGASKQYRQHINANRRHQKHQPVPGHDEIVNKGHALEAVFALAKQATLAVAAVEIEGCIDATDADAKVVDLAAVRVLLRVCREGVATTDPTAGAG
jgi:hypothetical protein